MSISNRFSIFLKAINSKQFDVAQLFHVKRQTISAIKRGRSNLTLDQLIVLMKNYPSLNTKWLLLGEGEMFLSENKELNDPKAIYRTNSISSKHTNTCNNPACIAEKNKLKDDKIALLEEINQLRKEKEEQKGISPPGKKVEGGVEEPLKNGTDG